MKFNFSKDIPRYSYLFFFSLNFSGAFWVIYLRSRGFSFVVIGLLEMVFHIASLLGEVPTGFLADRLGRKTSLILGCCASIFATILMLTMQSPSGIMLAFILSALSWTFHSGAFEAMVYDDLTSNGHEKTFTRVLGRFNAVFLAGSSIAALLGGIVAEYTLSGLYILNLFGDVLAIIALVGIKDIKFSKSAISPKALQQLQESIALCWEDRDLGKGLLIAGSLGACVTTSAFYGQSILREGGAALWIVGLTGTLANLAALIPAWVSHRFEESWGNHRATLVGARIIGIALFSLGVCSFYPFSLTPILLVLGMLIQTAAYEAIYPLIQNRLNTRIPSEKRATLLSAASMVFSMMMMVLFPLFGWAGDRLGLSFSYIVLGILMILVGMWVSIRGIFWRRKN